MPSIFLCAVLVKNFVDCLWLRPFALLTFFFVLRYLLLQVINCQLNHTHIKLILLPFGLGLRKEIF